MAVVSQVQAVTLRGTLKKVIGTNEKGQLNQVTGRMSEGTGVFGLDKEGSASTGNQVPEDVEACHINLGAAPKSKSTIPLKDISGQQEKV